MPPYPFDDLDVVNRANRPDGFSYRSVSDTDIQGMKDFSRVVNISFAYMMGHVDSTWQFIRKFFTYPEYLPGGIMLLLEWKTPIGTLNVSVDEENDNAVKLHQDEGFDKDQTVVCYEKQDLN